MDFEPPNPKPLPPYKNDPQSPIPKFQPTEGKRKRRERKEGGGYLNG